MCMHVFFSQSQLAEEITYETLKKAIGKKFHPSTLCLFVYIYLNLSVGICVYVCCALFLITVSQTPLAWKSRREKRGGR